MPDTELSIPDAARELGKSYNQTMRLVLLGALRSRRTESGRYLVLREDVARLRAQRHPAPAAA